MSCLEQHRGEPERRGSRSGSLLARPRCQPAGKLEVQGLRLKKITG